MHLNGHKSLILMKNPETGITTTQVSSDEQKKIMQRQPNLAQQSLDTLDPTKLTPLSPEVISRQATINIGIVNFC